MKTPIKRIFLSLRTSFKSKPRRIPAYRLRSNWSLSNKAVRCIHTSSFVHNTSSTPTKSKGAPLPASIGSLDIRVGKILEVQKHPDADLLYVEKIDVGEEQPRTIISGLVKHIPMEELQDRLVLVICNLPQKSMRGIVSQGMVMAATTMIENEEKVVLVDVPADAQPGEKLTFNVPEKPDESVTNKRFERIAKGLKTNQDGLAVYIHGEEELPFQTSGGMCRAPLKDAIIR